MDPKKPNTRHLSKKLAQQQAINRSLLMRAHALIQVNNRLLMHIKHRSAASEQETPVEMELLALNANFVQNQLTEKSSLSFADLYAALSADESALLEASFPEDCTRYRETLVSALFKLKPSIKTEEIPV